MIKIHKSITIKASADRVYELLTSPEHLPEIWPSLYEVKAVTKKPVRRFEWLYNFAGKRLAGKTETIEHILDEKIVEKTTGDIK
ncbi:MAG TPA: SRPBCC family protein, partial [Polyangiaceae bacterium]|nr:SRPBCC family protein [Polyangiaceae bacterium]